MLGPTIHMNGTDRESLLAAACRAGRAVQLALDALADAAPNGRDYYPQGPAALGEALRGYRVMYGNLESVRAELEALAESICDA